jgi:acyl-CoA reductase-like NAD-dependent aldehyde dehydrogenase
MKSENIISLLIDGVDVATDSECIFKANSFSGQGPLKKAFVQGASTDSCIRAVESCAKAFPAWRRTDAVQKRELFQRLGQVSSRLPHPRARDRRFAD